MWIRADVEKIQEAFKQLQASYPKLKLKLSLGQTSDLGIQVELLNVPQEKKAEVEREFNRNLEKVLETKEGLRYG